MKNNQEKTVLQRKIGEVIAANKHFTATIVVGRQKKHPLYQKSYKIDKKFLCENPENKFKEGDFVEIIPTRPLSRRKHYLINKVVVK